MNLPPLLERVVAGATHHPRATIAAWIGGALVSLVIAGTLLRVDTGTTTFLDRSGPAWKLYQETVHQFGGDEFITISLTGKEPYDWHVLADLEALSAEIGEIHGVRRVDSLATVPLIRRDEGGLIRLEGAVEGGVPEIGVDRERLRASIEKDLVARRFLISDDGRHVALNVMLDRDLDQDRLSVVEAIRHALRDHNAVVVGVPVFRTEVSARTAEEVAVFAPAVLILVGVVAYLWLRDVLSVVALLAVGSCGVSATFAAMAGMGVPLSLSTMILPSILIALGCAYTMHVVAAARGANRRGVRACVAWIVPAVVWSGVTTAIGFLAMSFTTVEAIRQLAAYGALGVLVVTAGSISLAPAILSLRPGNPGRGAGFERSKMLADGIVRSACEWRALVITMWLLMVLVLGYGVTRVDVDTNIIEWFQRSDPVRSEYEDVRSDFSGITPVSIVLRSTNGRKVTEPVVLRAAARLGRDLENLDIVGRVLSVTEPLHMVRRAFGKSGLPESVQEAEQYLLLFESDGRLSDLVASDRMATSLWLRMDSNDSDDVAGLQDRVRDWWETHGVRGVSPETTGVMFEFSRAQDEIARTQIRGLAVAIVAVGVVLWVALRSVKHAGIAMIANIIPIGMAFGAMGWIGVPLDAATVCLGSLALGIGVDDTVHVLSRAPSTAMGASVGQRGRSGEIAARLTPILPALFVTTLCLVFGFGVLGFSSFVLVRNLGVITAAVVGVCLVADVTLVPALLAAERKEARRAGGAEGSAGIGHPEP